MCAGHPRSTAFFFVALVALILQRFVDSASNKYLISAKNWRVGDWVHEWERERRERVGRRPGNPCVNSLKRFSFVEL